ncbi:circadian clock protein PASD1 [Fukomys damarensis]|uniref:circadian clock protein PASD1 n=1 Tax=Fukomys damarensis TaxID=885580 RepID=UPI0005401503|nr:circadian clock protein PASD1 [Fukomys damarensis]
MEGDERETKRSPPDKDEDLTEEYGYTVFEQIHTLMQRHECPKSGDGDKAQLGLTSSSTAIGTFSATTSGMSSSTVIRTSTSTVSQTSHSMIQSSSSTESQSSFSAVSHVSPLTIQSSSSAESQIYSTKSQTSLTRSQTPSENENQMSTAVSIIKQENLSSPVPADEQNWVPSFCNREEMSKVVLQALDCSMIVLSTDGVIFYITENITAVLGYLSSEVMGRKLLSFLPDEEKNEVYRNICLKPPLSESVGSHVEFCCHLKREMPTQGECPIYEYVKFVLTLRDICSKSFVFFGGFVPSGLCLESSAMKFSMEDRFLLVGSVCAINSEILKELCTMKQSCKSETNQDSDKEDSLMIYRSLQGITPGMSPAASSFDTCNVDPGLWEGSQEWKPTEQEKIAQVKSEQYGPEIIVQVKPEKSSSSSETSVSTSEDIPDSLTTTFHAFTYESSMDARRCQDPVDMEFVVDSSYLRESEDTMHWGEPVVQEAPLEPMVHKVKMEPVVPEELMEPVVQEDRPSSGVATRRRTQVQPATLSHVLSRPDLWPMKKTSRKQSPGKVKRSPSDGRDTKRFCTASQLGIFPERLEDFSDTFIQYLQELEPQIQQQEEEPKMTQQEELQVQEQEEEPKMTQQEELQIQQQEEEPKMMQQEELQVQEQEEEPKMTQQEELQLQQQEEEPKMTQQEELQIQQQEEEPKMGKQEELQVQQQEEEPKMGKQEELQIQQQEEEPKMTQQEELQLQQQEKPKMGQQEELQVQQQEEEPKMGQQEELQLQQQEKPKMPQREEPQMLQKQVPEEEQRQEQQLQQQQVQSRVSPLQMRAEQQPSSSIRDKDSKDQGEGSPSIHPEEQQGACMVAATSSGNSSESVSTPLSKSPIPPSDCTKGFIQVWLESSNSQDVFLELDTWSASDQSSGD